MTKDGVVKLYGWVVVNTKTGETLQHMKVDGGVEFMGVRWHSISAFAWAGTDVHVIPHFIEQGAKEMLELYKAQTGDKDAAVKKIEIS